MKFSRRATVAHRIVLTIGKQIIAYQTAVSAKVGCVIRIDKAPYRGVIVTALDIVEPGFGRTMLCTRQLKDKRRGSFSRLPLLFGWGMSGTEAHDKQSLLGRIRCLRSQLRKHRILTSKGTCWDNPKPNLCTFLSA